MLDIRCDQMKQLQEMTSESLSQTRLRPDVIFISGRAGSGKTHTIQRYLEIFGACSSYFECSFIYSFKDVICDLSRRIFRKQMSSEFEVISALKKSSTKRLLVFDHCDHFLSSSNSLLLEIPKLTNSNAQVILISRISPDLFYESALVEPHTIWFPSFTAKECEMIILNQAVTHDIESYRTFVGLAIGATFHHCNNVKYLRRFIEDNYPRYIQPSLDGKCSAQDWRKLWKLFEPNLKGNSIGGVLGAKDGPISESVELPFDSNYLLIAAYIASFNPPTSDKKFFVKGKQPKSRAQTKRIYHMLGPKPFPLERLLAIFYAINDELEEVKSQLSSLFAQIATLVNLKLLATHGAEGIESPKFLCLAKYEFVSDVSKKVNFELNAYLNDFA